MGEQAEYLIDSLMFGRGGRSLGNIGNKDCDWKIIGSTDRAWKVLNEAKTEWAWIPRSLALTNRNRMKAKEATKVISVANGSFTWQEYNFLEC